MKLTIHNHIKISIYKIGGANTTEIGSDSSNGDVILWHGKHAFTHVQSYPQQSGAVDQLSCHLTKHMLNT